MPDYSQLILDPFDPNTVSKLEQYDEFKFTVPDKFKTIAYMIIMFDPKSDMKKLWPDDFYGRKRESALAAGFEMTNGKFEKWVEELLIGENDDFNDAELRFTRMFGIPDYPAFVVYSDILDKQFRSAKKCNDEKKLKIIQENIENAMKMVALYERNIFGHAETENVRAALYRLQEKQRLNLRPEHIAELIEKKALKLKDPYAGEPKKRGRPRQ